MSKMFDKYKKYVEFTPITPFRPYKPEQKIIGTGAVKLLRDIKGNEIGVEAPRGSIFSLYFSIDGEVENGSVSDLLEEAKFTFSVYDYRGNDVYETDVDIDAYNKVLKVDIISDGNILLPYGNYSIKLAMEIDEFTYILINTNSMILSIN